MLSLSGGKESVQSAQSASIRDLYCNMKKNEVLKKVAFLYLYLVPVVTLILAFAVGHVSPTIYVPCWIIHSAFMLFTVWNLGAKHVLDRDETKSRLAVTAMLFVMPWIFATIFAGMGPPPFNFDGWAALAEEQQFRFGILVVCGLSLAAGYTVFHEVAKGNRETLYSKLALSSTLIALPLFIGVMTFWGTTFTDATIAISKTNPHVSPEWLAPVRHAVDFITIVETCLFYCCTAMIALSLKHLKWISPNACRVYFGISVFATVASLLPPSVPEPLVILNYVAGIPAITMVMPYLIGLNLLKGIAKAV